jgi:phospholipase/carboxylesterase
VRTASALLDRFIDVELQRLGLPSEAVVLAGFSQGAMMALYTGLRRPAAPRGIIGFSGALPGLQHIPQEMRNRAPVLLVHGEADPIVPAERSRDAENALRALEIPVRLVPVPGLGHAIDSSGMQAGLDFLRGVLA